MPKPKRDDRLASIIAAIRRFNLAKFSQNLSGSRVEMGIEASKASFKDRLLEAFSIIKPVAGKSYVIGEVREKLGMTLEEFENEILALYRKEQIDLQHGGEPGKGLKSPSGSGSEWGYILPRGEIEKELESTRSLEEVNSTQEGSLASPMSREHFENEISRDLAINAWRNVSWEPDKQAESFRDYYAINLISLRDEFLPQIPPERLKEFQDDFEVFHKKFLELANRYLNAMTKTASSAVVGPSKFPVEKNKKVLARAEKDREDIAGIIESTRKKLTSKYLPSKSNVIRSGEKETLPRLEEKLAALQHDHELMKQANAIIRKNIDVEKQLLDLGLTTNQINDILHPIGGNEPGYPTWSIVNSNAEIKRVRERIEEEKKREVTNKETSFDKGRIVENVAINRLLIFFTNEPDANIRNQLKHHGFHYSPKQKTWQRQLTNAAIKDARTILGITNEGQVVNPEGTTGEKQSWIYWRGLEAVPIFDLEHAMGFVSGILRYDVYNGPKGDYLDRVDLDKEDTSETAKQKVTTWIDTYLSDKWKTERDAKRNLDWAKRELQRTDNDIAYRTGPGAEETHIWLGDQENYAMNAWKNVLASYIRQLEQDEFLPRPSHAEVYDAAHEEYHKKTRDVGIPPTVSEIYADLTLDELLKAIKKMDLKTPFSIDSSSIGTSSVARFLMNQGITPEQIANTLGINLEKGRVLLLPETQLPHLNAIEKGLNKTTLYVVKNDVPWSEYGPIAPQPSIYLVKGLLSDTSHFVGEYLPYASDLFVLNPHVSNPHHAYHGLDLSNAMDANSVSIAYLMKETPSSVAQARERRVRKARILHAQSQITGLQTAIKSREEDEAINETLPESKKRSTLGPVGIAGMKGELAALESYKTSLERGEDPQPPEIERTRDAFMEQYRREHPST